MNVGALLRHYHCDLDVSKPHLESKRPDIILHRRGRNNQNFLVIEIKRNVVDVQEDIDRIQRWWFEPPLLYHFGAVAAIPDRATAADCFVRTSYDRRGG